MSGHSQHERCQEHPLGRKHLTVGPQGKRGLLGQPWAVPPAALPTARLGPTYLEDGPVDAQQHLPGLVPHAQDVVWEGAFVQQVAQPPAGDESKDQGPPSCDPTRSAPLASCHAWDTRAPPHPVTCLVGVGHEAADSCPPCQGRVSWDPCPAGATAGGSGTTGNAPTTEGTGAGPNSHSPAQSVQSGRGGAAGGSPAGRAGQRERPEAEDVPCT